MIKATILEGNIADNLWLELVQVMTYIKNSLLIRALTNNLRTHIVHFYERPDFSHMQILGFILYVLLHEEEDRIKLKN